MYSDTGSVAVPCSSPVFSQPTEMEIEHHFFWAVTLHFGCSVTVQDFPFALVLEQELSFYFFMFQMRNLLSQIFVNGTFQF